MMRKPSLKGRDNVKGKTALLVIDVQYGLFERATAIYRAEQLIKNINALIEKARRAGAEVVFVQHANKGTLLYGSEAWQLHPDIHPLHTETIIHKRHGSAFKETHLQEMLNANGIQTLVMAGLTTHGCVNATCAGALELGYEVLLVEDGHSSFSKNAAALIETWNQKLHELGATLRTADAIEFSKR